ncbi:hypothetical protein [Streptomyces sp. DH24]|uniref:hypothetical protein n=1 Tax=Streptomyces sp. DH24 TaxID=3040123 RepID=UPI00244347A3|nr:hypothetical protein [Streptomyces sp. DH24]MDG9719915.1 hypothetical protein [Streptomyces sp. DH24]
MTAVGAAAGTGPGVFDTWQESGPGDETDVVAVQPVTEGRAARRRQRARWKKNQRRAVVATAVALVSGSVAMVAMDQQSGDRARAATAPFDPGLDGAEEPNGHHSDSTTRPEKPRSAPTPPASERADRHDDGDRARTVPSTSRQEVAAPPRTTEAMEVSTPLPRTTVPPVSDTTGSAGSGETDGADPADVSAPTPTPTPPSAQNE